ncbi:MAG: hypothetical protein ACFE85_06955 [Candidatus Hodarchaeota archaeon]
MIRITIPAMRPMIPRIKAAIALPFGSSTTMPMIPKMIAIAGTSQLIRERRAAMSDAPNIELIEERAAIAPLKGIQINPKIKPIVPHVLPIFFAQFFFDRIK